MAIGTLAGAIGLAVTLANRSFEARLAGARAALRAGRYIEAEAQAQQCARDRPRSAAAQYLLAETAFATDQPEIMESALRQALTLGHPRVAVDRLRAFGLVRAGRYAEAEPILAPIVAAARAPDPEADEALARIYLQSYKLDLAGIVLDRWMRDAPNDARPHLWRTEIDRRAETDPAITISHYDAALERDPNLDAARLGRAEVLHEAHRNAEADQDFRAYLAKRPDDTKALVGAAQNAIDLGDSEAALGFLDRALALKPNDTTALLARARLALAAQHPEAALEDLNRAALADPFDQEIFHRRASVLTRLDRLPEAQADHQRVERLRRDQEELDAIQARLNKDPRDNDLRCRIARWMFDHGHPEAGLSWANLVLAEQRDHPAANRLLVEHYERTGDPGRANYYRHQARAE